MDYEKDDRYMPHRDIKEEYKIKIREECFDCNHLPVCKEELKRNLSGECPYYEPI